MEDIYIQELEIKTRNKIVKCSKKHKKIFDIFVKKTS